MSCEAPNKKRKREGVEKKVKAKVQRSERDLAKEFEENLKLAEEKGDPTAQLMVSFSLHYGRGVSRDENQAKVWLEKSAASGNLIASARSCYMNKDYSTSLNIFTRYVQEASERKREEEMIAYMMLGLIYHYDKGVPRDYKKALRYYEMADELGNEIANYYIALYYQLVKKDFQKAKRHYLKAANQKSLFNLGIMFQTGKGVPKDFKRALKYYSMAGNDGDSLNNLATMYKHGEGVEKSLGMAFKLYQKSGIKKKFLCFLANVEKLSK